MFILENLKGMEKLNKIKVTGILQPSHVNIL